LVHDKPPRAGGLGKGTRSTISEPSFGKRKREYSRRDQEKGVLLPVDEQSHGGGNLLGKRKEKRRNLWTGEKSRDSAREKGGGCNGKIEKLSPLPKER